MALVIYPRQKKEKKMAKTTCINAESLRLVTWSWLWVSLSHVPYLLSKLVSGYRAVYVAYMLDGSKRLIQIYDTCLWGWACNLWFNQVTTCRISITVCRSKFWNFFFNCGCTFLLYTNQYTPKGHCPTVSDIGTNCT